MGGALDAVKNMVLNPIAEALPKPAAPAASLPTPAMPLMDVTQVSKAAQSSVAAQIARQGRMSTIMSGTAKTDKLGG